jgi:hypothetical protein
MESISPSAEEMQPAGSTNDSSISCLLANGSKLTQKPNKRPNQPHKVKGQKDSNQTNHRAWEQPLQRERKELGQGQREPEQWKQKQEWALKPEQWEQKQGWTPHWKVQKMHRRKRISIRRKSVHHRGVCNTASAWFCL